MGALAMGALVIAGIAAGCGGDDATGTDAAETVASVVDSRPSETLGTSGLMSSTVSTRSCSSFAGEPVDAEDFTTPCEVDEETAELLNTPAGELFVAGTATTLCEDGRVLIWNDLGWGYENEPFTFHDEGAEQVAPEAERQRCTPEP
jgi:hypothetical protein